MSSETINLSLGTATPGGGFPFYGEALARAVNQRDSSVYIACRNTKGSTENVPLLEQNELDFALVQGEVAYEAFAGIGRLPAYLWIVAAMYSTPGMFAVRADSPVQTVTDLVGSRVAFGAKGSGLVILNRYVLDGLGLVQDRDFDAVFLDKAGDGPDMVIDGRVAALWGGGTGWPGFVKIFSGPEGGRFITPTTLECDRILAKHAFLKPLTLSAGSYPGQPEAIASVGSWSLILARRSLSDGSAYNFVRALDRAHDALVGEIDQATETTPQNTIAAAPRRDLIHPGALRYFEEIGLI
ncbi:ABC transporter, phosphonate, periplasmic substrate-binding protein [Variibacter gotjawalensis]|uniref:ABC transporter, phosphonate, periplasmic substrate-binding protein n=2 Tax=Variibacter gotjawalensis TaxID=1333996 RepID=A0A0S3Q0Y5_9BRAD|nr:hypothetical protein [Variibacter gotjawalensis]RZS49577.1 hypothetical protein EV661_2012 [Variibacter gotjawalensis]BAT61839.1 ABC transporter, phosphonate, periplasmic substrate-binding protein [Variibacter gotjawalensis]